MISAEEFHSDSLKLITYSCLKYLWVFLGTAARGFRGFALSTSLSIIHLTIFYQLNVKIMTN